MLRKSKSAAIGSGGLTPAGAKENLLAARFFPFRWKFARACGVLLASAPCMPVLAGAALAFAAYGECERTLAAWLHASCLVFCSLPACLH